MACRRCGLKLAGDSEGHCVLCRMWTDEHVAELADRADEAGERAEDAAADAADARRDAKEDR